MIKHKIVMKKALKIISINILIILALLMVTDFVSMVIMDSFVITKKIKGKMRISNNSEIQRWTLENYDTIPWAKTHFVEMGKVSTEYKSFYAWRRTKFNGETINIDSLGIRNTTYQSNQNLPVVVFLGGSTMFGEGSNDIGTIPSYFSKKTKGRYKVLNYGESAYTAYQSIVFLQTQLAKGHLDSIKIIITYDGVNNSKFKRDNFSHLREKQIQLAMKGKDAQQGYMFMNYTRKLIKKIKSKPVNFDVPKSKNNYKLAAIELLESWLMLKKISDVNDADFICILQPVAYIGKPDLTNFKNGLDYSREKQYNYYKYVKDFIRNNKRYNILNPHFVDMTNAFDGIPNLYIDFCHVSPLGNEIIADEVLKNLKN